jgi:hypothetical protein
VTYDPCRAVYEALEEYGFEPHGVEHRFRSRCPAHRGDNHYSLTVSEGADGRALLHCFAYQCTARDIAKAINLPMSAATPRFDVAERCPSCGFEDFWLYGEGDDVYLACWAGCPPTAIIRALTHGAPNGRARSDLAAVCVQDVPYDPYLVP